MESKIRASMSKQAYYDTFDINKILSDIEVSAKSWNLGKLLVGKTKRTLKILVV